MFSLIFFRGSCKIVKTTNFGIIFLDTKAVRSTAVLGVKVAVAIKESSRGYYNLGNILLRLDRPDQARRAYEDALRLDPGLAAAHSNLGLIAGNDGRPVAAEDYFRRALEVDPDLVVARYNLAQLLVALGREVEAVPELRAVLDLDPSHAGALTLMTRLQTQR